MKNYITEETLLEILNDLAGKFLEDSDKLSVNITLDRSDLPRLTVRTSRYGSSKNELFMLAEKSYDIIEKVHDTYDVIGETIPESFIKIN